MVFLRVADVVLMAELLFLEDFRQGFDRLILGFAVVQVEVWRED